MLEKARAFYQQEWAVGVLFEHLKETLGQDREALLLAITRIEFEDKKEGRETDVF